MGDPWEKPPDHPQAELGFEQLRVLKISALNHLAMGATLFGNKITVGALGLKVFSQTDIQRKVSASPIFLAWSSSTWTIDQMDMECFWFYKRIISMWSIKMSRDMTKPTKWLCAQRRLRSAQSVQSLCCPHEESFHWAHSEDSDQTGRMPRLIGFFTGCTLTLLVLSCRGSFDCMLPPSKLVWIEEQVWWLQTTTMFLIPDYMANVIRIFHDSQG